jgi:hypothetical protein
MIETYIKFNFSLDYLDWEFPEYREKERLTKISFGKNERVSISSNRFSQYIVKLMLRYWPKQIRRKPQQYTVVVSFNLLIIAYRLYKGNLKRFKL